jgi:hypothetical protein
VRKRGFLRHLYIKVIFLPRQARDKHRENSKNTFFRAVLMLKNEHLPRQARDKHR